MSVLQRARSLPFKPQLERYKPGRTLLIDGDGPLYAVAATVKTMATAIRRAQQRILELIFLAEAEDARVHLTASISHKAGRFAVKAAKPYQGNRDGKVKPPLLEPLREAMAREENWLPEFTVVMHYVNEADDGLIMDAYRLGSLGVMWSQDKDLRMTPGPYFEIERGLVMAGAEFGRIEVGYTPGGDAKPQGQGIKFFWWQMLMGDSADNVQGLARLEGKRVGLVRAYDFLKDIHHPDDVANAVIGAYRQINQNPIPEAYLLWLLRSPHDDPVDHLRGYALSPENRDFLEDCYGRDWYTTAHPPTSRTLAFPYPEAVA